MEEPLLRTEDSGDTIGGDTPFLEFLQVCRPELVLHENSHRRTQCLNELFRVTTRSEGQVEHTVRRIVVLAHLVARGREERDDDFLLRVLALEPLYHRSRLLELAYRGGVKPHASAERVQLFRPLLEGFALSLYQQLRLLMPAQRRDSYQ